MLETIISFVQLYDQKIIIDSITYENLYVLIVSFVCYIVCGLLLCWTFKKSGIVLHELRYKISGDIYNDLLKAIYRLKHTELKKRSIAEYIIYFRDIEEISGTVFDIICEFFTLLKLIVALMFIAHIDNKIAIICTIIMILHFGMVKVIYNKSSIAIKAQIAEEVIYLRTIKNCVDGTREIIANESKEWAVDQVNQSFKGYLKRVNKVIQTKYLKILFTDTMRWVIVATIVFGSVLNSNNLILSSGSILLLYQLVNALVNDYFRISGYVIAWPHNKHIIERILWIYDEKDDVQEKMYLDENISFDDVSCDMFSSQKKILSNITFDIKKGDTVLIRGESGKGKTTLIKLLTKQINKTNGKIYFGDTDIDDIDEKEIEKMINCVFQEPQIINASIRDNILLGNKVSSEQELLEICYNVDLIEFINSQEHGLDTIIGDNGLNISGGERQRIALARVLVQNKPILILDEAMTALDVHTERDIIEKIIKIREGKTNIIVAHRGGFIEKANKILDI